ncbi:Protein EFFECTOR OF TRANSCRIPTION 2, partial [Bienertia sinuspersici]
MKSKSEAERTEAKLLGTFDYAWNKIGNGARRQNEILNKFETISSQNNKTSKIMKLLQSFSFNEQKVGIPIKAEKLSSDSNKTSHDNYNENDRSTCSNSPVKGRKRCAKHKGICGVKLGDGKCCERQPVKGRKRCEQHKGMR